MSGGAYNHLASEANVSGLVGVAARRDSLQKMLARLQELGHWDAADKSQEILDLLQIGDAKCEALADVWLAVELCDSGDTTADTMLADIERWRASQPISPLKLSPRRRILENRYLSRDTPLPDVFIITDAAYTELADGSPTEFQSLYGVPLLRVTDERRGRDRRDAADLRGKCAHLIF